MLGYPINMDYPLSSYGYCWDQSAQQNIRKRLISLFYVEPEQPNYPAQPTPTITTIKRSKNCK
jgi:hypothetical protein